MSYGDQKTYRTFEEFEREEMRRMDAVGGSVDEMIEKILNDDIEPYSCASAWGAEEDADE